MPRDDLQQYLRADGLRRVLGWDLPARHQLHCVPDLLARVVLRIRTHSTVRDGHVLARVRVQRVPAVPAGRLLPRWGLAAQPLPCRERGAVPELDCDWQLQCVPAWDDRAVIWDERVCQLLFQAVPAQLVRDHVLHVRHGQLLPLDHCGGQVPQRDGERAGLDLAL